MEARPLVLQLLTQRLAICRLSAAAAVPDWVEAGAFLSVTRTFEELSIVCEEAHVPAEIDAARGWRALRVAGTLDLRMVGVLAALAGAAISIFAVSTWDTDYILVREAVLATAVDALRAAGHVVRA